MSGREHGNEPFWLDGYRELQDEIVMGERARETVLDACAQHGGARDAAPRAQATPARRRRFAGAAKLAAAAAVGAVAVLAGLGVLAQGQGGQPVEADAGFALLAFADDDAEMLIGQVPGPSEGVLVFDCVPGAAGSVALEDDDLVVLNCSFELPMQGGASYRCRLGDGPGHLCVLSADEDGMPCVEQAARELDIPQTRDGASSVRVGLCLRADEWRRLGGDDEAALQAFAGREVTVELSRAGDVVCEERFALQARELGTYVDALGKQRYSGVLDDGREDAVPGVRALCGTGYVRDGEPVVLYAAGFPLSAYMADGWMLAGNDAGKAGYVAIADYRRARQAIESMTEAERASRASAGAMAMASWCRDQYGCELFCAEDACAMLLGGQDEQAAFATAMSNNLAALVQQGEVTPQAARAICGNAYFGFDLATVERFRDVAREATALHADVLAPGTGEAIGAISLTYL